MSNIRISEIVFNACAILLSLVILAILLDSGAFQMPRDLKDVRWGTLPQFEAIVRPIKQGSTRESVIHAFAGRPFSITNKSDITCLWESQPHGYFKDVTRRRYTYIFDPAGILTNIDMKDNEQEDEPADGNHGGFLKIILR
jgi:hypothetical protein